MRTLWRSLSWPVLTFCVASCGRIDYDLSARDDAGAPSIDARAPIDGSVLPPADAGPDGGNPDVLWWDPAWSHRIRLTIDTTGQTEDLFDVPIAIHLNDTRVDPIKVRPDGADLRFVASDNKSLLDYEIELKPRAGAGPVVGSGAVIWVKVPELKATGDESYIWLYYGKTVSEPAERPDSVWSAGYIGVWHLNQLEDPRDDATGKGNALAGYGPIPSAAGKLGDALAPTLYIDGLPLKRDAFELGENVLDGFTIEAWVNATSSIDHMVIAARSDGDVARSFELVRLSDGTTALHLSFDCTSSVDLYSPALVEVGSWHHVAATFDGEEMRMYQDGVLTAKRIVTIEPPGDDGGVLPSPFVCESGAPFTLGALENGQFRLDGYIDELRISGHAQSAEWIRVQYRATFDDLIGYGAQEAQP